jgi:hypothetical protein
MAENMGLTVRGYGAPESGVQHAMNIKLTASRTHHINFVRVYTFDWICNGDSGAPGFRNSGYTDSLGSYWNAQASVHSRSEKNAAFSSGAECGPEGRQSRVSDKVDWIEDIVEFWTNKTCEQFTNPAGEQALWCWAPL